MQRQNLRAADDGSNGEKSAQTEKNDPGDSWSDEALRR